MYYEYMVPRARELNLVACMRHIQPRGERRCGTRWQTPPLAGSRPLRAHLACPSVSGPASGSRLTVRPRGGVRRLPVAAARAVWSGLLFGRFLRLRWHAPLPAKNSSTIAVRGGRSGRFSIATE